MMKMSTLTEEKNDTVLDEVMVDDHVLVLHNDDYNTFDHVIESLVKVCQHEVIQAEQCAWIVHNNGKCSVKKGYFEKLKPMCEALLDRGLSAEIN